MSELKLLKQEVAEAVSRRAEFLFESHQRTNLQRTDRLFAGLMLFQWVAAIVAALWIAPRTWEGYYSQTHPHVWAALLLSLSFFPFLFSSFPLFSLPLPRPVFLSVTSASDSCRWFYLKLCRCFVRLASRLGAFANQGSIGGSGLQLFRSCEGAYS